MIDYENISTEEPLVFIEPGAPAYIGIAIGGVAQYDGDSLYMPLGVGVWDSYTNPAGFGDTVFIDIAPDSIVEYDNIVPLDPRYYPDSLGGYGLTALRFVCDHSLEMIRITATIGDLSDTSRQFPLGVYNPDLFLTADPGVVSVSPPDTIGYSDISVQLIDGRGCEIANGIINFSALMYGEISRQARDTTDSDGYAYSEFMIHIDDIPGQPPDPPQCTAVVRATLFGYPDVEGQVEIICTRP